MVTLMRSKMNKSKMKRRRMRRRRWRRRMRMRRRIRKTPETHTLTGLEFLGLLTPQQPRPVAPTLQEAEAAGDTSHVDKEQQLLSESAGGDSLPDVPLLDVTLPDVPLPDGPLPDVPLPDVTLPRPDVPLPDVPLHGERPDGSVGKEWPSHRVAEKVCIYVRVGFLSCDFALL
jgi:hypothetical protein